MSMKKKEGGSYGSPSPTKQNEGGTMLKEDFIYEILGAEDAFKKYKNKQNLTRLISLYRKLVEHYSEKNDKIALYFTDKIGSVSSEMPSLQESDEKVTMSMAREAEDDKSPTDVRFKNIITTPVAYDPEIKKKERSKNAQIAIEVNKVKKRQNARTILKSYYEEWEENNKIVLSDLKAQRKQLEDKLLAIRKLWLMKTNAVRKSPTAPSSFDKTHNIMPYFDSKGHAVPVYWLPHVLLLFVVFLQALQDRQKLEL